MSVLVNKDSKNRLPAGPEVEGTYFLREIDERGRIIFTPQILVPKNEYEEKIITLNDQERDVFVQSLLAAPDRNSAFKKARSEFKKKHK